MLIWLNYNLKKNLKICKITSYFANILNDDPPLSGVEPRIFNGCRICQDIILIHQDITNARDSSVLNVRFMLPWRKCIELQVLTLFRWKTDENQSQTTMSRWVHNSAWWYRIYRVIVGNDSLGYERQLCRGAIVSASDFSVYLLSKDKQKSPADAMIYLLGEIWL